MAKPTVANRESRAVATLKVAAVYLLTFFLLLWLLFQNRQVKADAPDNFQSALLEKEQLKQLITIADTLTSLTEQLVAVDQKLSEGEVAQEIERQKLEVTLDGQQNTLVRMDNPDIKKQIDAVIHISKYLLQSRKQIDVLYDELKIQKLASDQGQAAAIEQVQEESEAKETALQADIDAKKAEIDGLRAKVASLEGSSSGTQISAANAQELSTKLRTHLEQTLVKVNEVYGLVEKEYTSNSWFKDRKQLDVLYTRLSNLKTFVEGAPK